MPYVWGLFRTFFWYPEYNHDDVMILIITIIDCSMIRFSSSSCSHSIFHLRLFPPPMTYLPHSALLNPTLSSPDLPPWFPSYSLIVRFFLTPSPIDPIEHDSRAEQNELDIPSSTEFSSHTTCPRTDVSAPDEFSSLSGWNSESFSPSVSRYNLKLFFFFFTWPQRATKFEVNRAGTVECNTHSIVIRITQLPL